MRQTFVQRLWNTAGRSSWKPRRWAYDIPRCKIRFNSSTSSASTSASANVAGSAKVSAKPVKPSILVTHGEAIFRLILVSQATFGVLTVFWWHMHYFEIQDEKNLEIATLKRQLKEELQLQLVKNDG